MIDMEANTATAYAHYVRDTRGNLFVIMDIDGNRDD